MVFEYSSMRVFRFASFWVGLVKFFCTLMHEIPDQVRDGGEVNLYLNKLFIVV